MRPRIAHPSALACLWFFNLLPYWNRRRDLTVISKQKNEVKQVTWISISVCCPWAPPSGWWIMIRELGRLYRLPASRWKKQNPVALIVKADYSKGNVKNTTYLYWDHHAWQYLRPSLSTAFIMVSIFVLHGIPSCSHYPLTSLLSRLSRLWLHIWSFITYSSDKMP